MEGTTMRRGGGGGPQGGRRGAAAVWMTVSYEAKAGERAYGRATAAGGAPATATLFRPPAAQPPLLLEQAGNCERESALTRFTTLMATAARAIARMWRNRLI